MKYKLLYISLVLLLFINIVNSQESLGNIQQGQCIQLRATCGNCSFINITSVAYPDNTFALYGNYSMDKNAGVYNYSFCDTAQIGTYTYTLFGDGVLQTSDGNFDVKGGTLGFFIIAFIFSFGLTFYGIKIQNAWVGLIGCLGVALLGVYMSFYGIDLYKNDLTKGISYLTIAIGVGLGIEALMEITYK